MQTAIDGLSNSTAADKTGVKAGHLKFVCWAGYTLYTELLVLMLRDYLLERVSARVGGFLATGVLIPLWKNKEHTDIRPVTVRQNRHIYFYSPSAAVVKRLVEDEAIVESALEEVDGRGHQGSQPMNHFVCGSQLT